MNLKSILSKLLNGFQISVEELTFLINQYVFIEKGKEPTPEELKYLTEFINRGLFSLEYVIDRIKDQPNKYHLKFTYLYDVNKEDKTGMFDKRLIKVIIEDCDEEENTK